MDELRIRTGFVKSIVAKMISMMIKKKLGYKISIQITDLDITFDNDVANVHINADAKMNVNELKKITRLIDQDGESE